MEDMVVSDLESRANMLINQGKYTEAIPFVEKVLQEIAAIQDPELLKAIQPQIERLDFILAFCNLAAGQHQKAVELFTAFAKKYPRSRRVQQGLSMKAYAQMALEDWPGAVESLRELLTKYRLPAAERVETLLSLGMALNANEQYREAFSPLQEALITAQNPAVRMSSMSELLEVLTNVKDSKLLYELVVALQGQVSPARYSFSFNLQALEAADAMIQEGNYSDAFVLLKLCQEKDVLEEGLRQVEAHLRAQEQRLKQMNILESFQQVIANSRRLQVVAAEQKALATAEDYTEGLRLRIAQVLGTMQRLYESFWAYLSFSETYPESEHAPLALFGAASLAGELGLIERALELGYRFLEKFPQSEFAPQISFTIAYTHKAANELDKAIAVLDEGVKDGIYKTAADKGHAYFLLGHCELYRDGFENALKWFDRVRKEAPDTNFREDADYWTAYINLGSGEFEKAQEQFQQFVADYPNGRYTEDASYRLPLSTFGAENYEEAYGQIKQFVKAHPKSDLLGDAYNVLGDICGAIGKLDEAIEAYDLVEGFTTDPKQTHTAVFNAARVMETDERWEQLLAHLQQYLDRYGDSGQYSMAVYRMGAALTNLGRIDEMLALYLKTFERFQNDPTALGADYLLRDYVIKFQENEIDKTLTAAAEKREEERKRKLAAMTEKEREAEEKLREQMTAEEKRAEEQARLDEAAQEHAAAEADAKKKLLAVLKEKYGAIDAAEQPTAAIRLLWALHRAGDDSLTPKTFSPEQIAAGSPATLVWMGTLLEQNGDPKTAASAFRRVVDEFLETEWTAKAMFMLGEMEFQQGNLDEAMTHFNNLYELFPTNDFAGRSVMRMGDILLQQKKYDDAIEAYESVVMTREWRGPLWPEGIYKVGRCLFDQGNVEKAFAYFQRVYVLYGGHPEWVAKAYLDSGKCLIKLGRKAEAASTFQEMLDNESLADRPEGKEAEKLMKTLPPPPASPPVAEARGGTNGN